MDYAPMHATNYVNWFIGSKAGIKVSELDEHIKNINYQYASRSSQSPDAFFAYCDSTRLESKVWLESCRSQDLDEEQFEVCLLLISSVYDRDLRREICEDIEEILSYGKKTVQDYFNKCKKELVNFSFWGDMTITSKNDFQMALIHNNEAITNMGRGDLPAASNSYKQSSEYYRKAGFKGHYHKTLALHYDNTVNYEHSKTSHYTDPSIYIKLQNFCKKARENYDKALSYENEQFPYPAEMSYYIGKGNPDLSGEKHYSTLSGEEASVINSNSWAISARSRLIQANHVNHYALHKMGGEQQTNGLFEAAFQSLSASHCSLFAGAYSQTFSESSMLDRISNYYNYLADYYWYRAEALQTANQMRESVYNLEIAKDKIDEATKYYSEGSFGEGSHFSQLEGHDSYARSQISNLRKTSHRLGAEIIDHRSVAEADAASGSGTPNIKLNYEYLDKPTIGDVCNIKFSISNHGAPISNVSAKLKNGKYHIEGLDLPIDYPAINVAKLLDSVISLNSITTIYDGKDPIFVINYEFEGKLLKITI
tara:strand:+ start:288 stop:1901 length:1614 start_codon:yes stop_codon:yes gene_type:complete